MHEEKSVRKHTSYVSIHDESNREIAKLKELIAAADQKQQERSEKATMSALKRHEETAKLKPELLKLWASGKYRNKQLCAEEECAALGVAYDTARKWLQNAPDPYPWPAKEKT